VTRYLLDSNIFIQARNLHYGFDFCPAFWEWLIAQNAAGLVRSIARVADELLAGDDDLSDWARARGSVFFLPPDDLLVPALARVSAWANGQRFERAAIATFLQVADYWLVAHALAHCCTVVTHEVPADSVRKIKIPNACIGLTIPCISPYDMLRRERARFVLGPSPERAA
jgi:predicted nucleic acid-binding protein